MPEQFVHAGSAVSLQLVADKMAHFHERVGSDQFALVGSECRFYETMRVFLVERGIYCGKMEYDMDSDCWRFGLDGNRAWIWLRGTENTCDERWSCNRIGGFASVGCIHVFAYSLAYQKRAAIMFPHDAVAGRERHVYVQGDMPQFHAEDVVGEIVDLDSCRFSYHFNRSQCLRVIPRQAECGNCSVCLQCGNNVVLDAEDVRNRFLCFGVNSDLAGRACCAIVRNGGSFDTYVNKDVCPLYAEHLMASISEDGCKCRCSPERGIA